jgi:HSP20 family protein
MLNALVPFRHLDEVFDSFFWPVRADRPGNGDERLVRHAPYADVLEGEKEYLIRLDMPGVDRKDLNVEVEDQILTVTAVREQSLPEGYEARRKELPGKFQLQRSFRLGGEVDADKIGASLEAGVLTITLPKAERILPRRIDIR